MNKQIDIEEFVSGDASTSAPSGILTPLQGALDWASRGFHVFPITAGKKAPPLVLDWENAANTDEAQIELWATQFPNANFGCALGRSGHVALDLDCKNGKDGVAELERISREHGVEIPDTLAVATPSGGFHLYLIGRVQSSANRIAPGIDVRSSGGYVLVPGSVIDGKRYTVEHDVAEWDVIPDAPPTLLTLAEKKKTAPHAASANVALDQPQNIGRAVEYLRNGAAPAVDGHGGNSQTLAVACAVRDLGVSEELCLRLMAEHYNPRCKGSWPQDELAIIVANAYRYAENEAGCDAVPSIEDCIAPEILNRLKAEAATPSQRVGDGPQPINDLLGLEVGPVQELVAGSVERGVVTFFSGPGGSNKSRAAIHWGLAIDSGAPIYGRAVQPATFVYYSTEDPHDEVTRRVQKITRRLKLPADGRGQYWDRVGKDSAFFIMSEGGGYELAPFYHQACEHLRSIPGHKFVVLDSCYNFVRFQGKAKIDEGAVNSFVSLLQRICIECDATLLVLWHPSQAGQERGDASGWSVAWHNAPRARLSITPAKDSEDTFTLKVEKRNHGPKGPSLTLHWSDGVLLPRAETDTTEHEAMFRRSVVRVATMAAECGAPMQKQRRVEKWQLDEIEADVGRRPTDREVKDVLHVALPAGLLRYVGGSQHRTAGYYPADERRAQELAHAAKRGTKTGGDHE